MSSGLEQSDTGAGLDALGLALLVVSMTVSLLLVPELTPELMLHPCFAAIAGAAIALAAIVVLRARGRRGSRQERLLLAAFLFLMPTIYISAGLRFGADTAAIAVELGGQLVYGALAIAGARRAPWLLAAGIAAHGILWDSWHYGHSSFIPNWYAVGCAVIDVSWAVYAAAQVRAWQGAR